MKQHNDFHFHRLGYCPWKEAFLLTPSFKPFKMVFGLGPIEIHFLELTNLNEN